MPLVTIADLNDPEEAREKIELAKQLSLFYDEYVNTEDDDSHARAPGIHPSEFSSCMRKVTYNMLDFEKKTSVNKFWRQRFKMGHAIHDMIQKDCQKLAQRTKKFARQLAKERHWILEFEKEVPISAELQPLAKELGLAGHCDGIFTFRETLHGPAVLRVGIEIKSESKDEFEKLTEPRPYHVDQCHLYMAALDLPLMWFFYFSKGTQNNTNSGAPWLIPFNPDVWTKIEERCREAIELGRKKVLGPREESITCQFCPYAWDCQPTSLLPGRGKPSSKLQPLRMPKVG
jgi:CRISPR/Cas system-associated exonuclease Cas4 (RecB family)